MNNEATDRYIGELASSCAKAGITLRLVATPQVRAGSLRCSGFFDGSQLVVATGQPQWISILIHESSHMDQCLEKSRLWRDLDNPISNVDGWLADKSFKMRNKLADFSHVVELELDAERRSVRKIDRYSLEIDRKEYIQKANSYLFAYGWAMRYRKWFPQPYLREDIWKRMPVRFQRVATYLDPKHPVMGLYGRPTP